MIRVEGLGGSTSFPHSFYNKYGDYCRLTTSAWWENHSPKERNEALLKLHKNGKPLPSAVIEGLQKSLKEDLEALK